MRSFPRLLPVVILLVASSPQLAVAKDAEPCTIQDGTRFFDLRPLMSKKDYEVKNDAKIDTFKLNLCQPVKSEVWKLDKPDDVGGFYRGPHSDLSIGKPSSNLTIVDGSPVLTMSGGSPCGPKSSEKDALQRSTAIRFVCDSTVFSEGQPQLIAQFPPNTDESCAYFIEWKTYQACAGAAPSSNGGPLAVFSGILFVALLAYIVGGVFYNRVVLGLRGWDQLPRISIFSFSDTRDFIDRVQSRLRSRRRAAYDDLSWGSWRRDGSAILPGAGGPRSAGGYGAPPVERGVVRPAEEEAMLDERFSLDEDDEGARDNQPLTSAVPPGMDSGGVIKL